MYAALTDCIRGPFFLLPIAFCGVLHLGFAIRYANILFFVASSNELFAVSVKFCLAMKMFFTS